MFAATLGEEQALEVAAVYPPWAAGIAYDVGEILSYGVNGVGDPQLYRVVQAHTSQADWTPDKTPALWAVIDVAHAGTVDDPIPASRGMDYIYGKYYLDPEDSKTYLCSRTGEEQGGTVVLQYLPHELVGQYFEEATV